jgi:hypothetical protein
VLLAGVLLVACRALLQQGRVNSHGCVWQMASHAGNCLLVSICKSVQQLACCYLGFF